MLLRSDPTHAGGAGAELIEPLGFDGGKSIVDDYLREVRPLFVRGAHASADGLSAWRDLPVRSVGAARAGPGRPRPDPPGWVVVCCLGYSRAGAGALIFSKEAPDIFWGMGRCLWSAGGVAGAAGVGSRGRICTPAAAARPRPSPRFCGQLAVGWYFCDAGDAQAKGVRRALQGFMETNFEPGRRFANAARLPAPARRLVRHGQRPHAPARCARVPIERLIEERAVMRPLPARDARHRPALGDPGPPGAVSAL